MEVGFFQELGLHGSADDQPWCTLNSPCQDALLLASLSSRTSALQTDVGTKANEMGIWMWDYTWAQSSKYHEYGKRLMRLLTCCYDDTPPIDVTSKRAVLTVLEPKVGSYPKWVIHLGKTCDVQEQPSGATIVQYLYRGGHLMWNPSTMISNNSC